MPLEKCVVSGQVVKAGSGEPLKKARVVLRKEEGRETPRVELVDSNGRFQFKDVEPGRYRVYAVRNGYVRQEYGQRSPNHPGTALALVAGQQVKDVVFKLVPAAVIAGRIYDEDGEPVASARVQAQQYRYMQGKRQLVPMRFATTNDRGEYRLIGLPAGRYTVSATFSPMMTLGLGFEAAGQAMGNEGYAPTYYPNTNDAARATPVEVRAGNEVGGIDFLLLPTRAVRIRGRVYNAVLGKPGRDIWLMIFPAATGGAWSFGPDNQARVNETDGSFEFGGVTPGTYNLFANWSDNDRTSYTARQLVEVGASDVDGVTLTIQAGVDLHGTVRSEGKTTGANNEQEASAPEQAGEKKLELSDLRVLFERSDQEFIRFGGREFARVQDDGSYRLQNVSDDRYRVLVGQLPPDYYLKSARLDGNDVLEEGLTVSGPPQGPLELIISPNGGQVEGAVLKDQKPFSGATVTLVPEERRRERRELFKTATTDQYGRFALRGIAPGTYQLYAWEEIEPGAHQDSEFLKPYAKLGHEVKVEEGNRLSAELKLIPAGDPPR
ncbi:MAG: MSCRAMM family protein [Candidatus Acidiferrales bacterium]